MRYIADGNGYLQEVSFGADIECNGNTCTEYTGDVPAGYDSLADWFTLESDKLHRWHIVEGQLTLDAQAPEPKVYVEPEPYSMTLLWENASPASEFASQTIALDLSSYDSVQIEFDESWQAITSRINVGKNGGVDQIGDIYRDVAAYFYVAHRDIRVTTAGVTFGSRLYKYANGQWPGTANNSLIPFRIYGIKLGGSSAEEETGNLLDNSKMLDGYYISSRGEVVERETAICCEEYIDITKAKGTHLAIYAYHSDLGAYRCYYRMCFYDGNKTMVSYHEAGGEADLTKAVVEIPAGAVYARISFLAKGDEYTYMVVRGAADMPLGYYD